MQTKEYSIEVGGKTLTARFTDLADQANGSVMLQYGDSIVLATAVMGGKREGLNYFPLMVDYEEKFYAAGQILGSRFVRREGRPTEEAVLSGRVVDRTIRPFFSQHIRNEVQVVITVLSIKEDDPDVLAINAASLALLTSDIPWNGPVSAVRVGGQSEQSELSINPTYAMREHEHFELDLMACGRDSTINMIEVGAREVSEAAVIAALEKASEEIEKLNDFQQSIQREIGKVKREMPKPETPKEVGELFAQTVEGKLDAALFSGVAGKGTLSALQEEWSLLAKEKLSDESKPFADDYFEQEVNALIHREAIERERRADGRKLNELRPLYAQAGKVSPILHGSGIFYRGGTHVFSALTLGGPGEAQIIDNIEIQEDTKRFMHHYNFPPFSSGETGRLGGFNRRMIGHGALAEKALLAVIPPKEQFPYTIRLVSECMASNGSTSMGSVCAGTLALMDGGVPIKAPVAGIAIGLMSRVSRSRGNEGSANDLPFASAQGQNLEYKILTDIQGPEDHHGDMDFKVAGTRNGISAIQLDVKVDGVPISILAEALLKAKEARSSILDVIEKEIPAPRPAISPNAPEIVILSIPIDKIGSVIGPGGKVINKIKADTGVQEITIEDDGTVYITGKGGTGAKAAEIISGMTREYKPGEAFIGEVTRLMQFGAFVRIGPTTEGLVHISEIAPYRVDRIDQALKVGERVPVLLKEVDEKGRLNLSIKDADPEFATRHGIPKGTGTNGIPRR
ncbi:polyribonucleotide nucleotidyltransferase [Candidatus Kaiserbacteria bacterium RIFCSPHIGHO2_02_FULL_50_9]|uniref:Polyribonucleotide nucleotidyltransferase n=1 Tax=Candidatus Kaiserbacteria bacterium RIFCSPLOWO2_01_FULL_51_21 TaxID=1798508 RepID=A0A1F6EDC1_9BACT|nr:MAG: polyribonucleotide nucleotidyltransferase [Candidatus Kaiserbacteria bacterium RIFCSPHIGHO2_02_FULL_50_9]OGG71675.1 MAG: polyribonucleotide nucleotidyltransferase [Candidatus Kaiserbacteria bacterium RIFCSPLOWO2_01_FULL_51_21]